MDKKFEYTQSAPQNAEIERIRKKYEPKTITESKLEQIKRLDKVRKHICLNCFNTYLNSKARKRIPQMLKIMVVRGKTIKKIHIPRTKGNNLKGCIN